MSGVATGYRGPEFYTDMNPIELAAHQARDNGNLSPDMIVFDKQIELIVAMSNEDKLAVNFMKWEAIKNG